MAKLLVFQHVPYEILGTLDPVFRSFGFRIRYVNFGRDPEAQPRLEGYEGLVVLGGPMNVSEVKTHPHLRTEIELIQEAIESDLPILGICLGAQLIASALGAAVRPNKEKEIGWYDVSLTPGGQQDPVLAPFDPTEKIFQWHGETFDIPRGAVHLAASAACRNQAFRFGQRVYGFQFHLEVDAGLIERWLSVPVHLQELERLQGQIDPETIRRETRLHIARSEQLGELIFTRFVHELFGERRRREVHPHR